jgi:hypothetical protein
MHPSLSRAFQRHQEHHAPVVVQSFPKTPRTRSEASQFSRPHNYKTKQNKLPSFIDRLKQTKTNIKPKNVKLIIKSYERKKRNKTHFIQGSQVKSAGFANPKRYERENDNKNCDNKSKPMFKSFASSLIQSPFCRPTNLKT